ncbi:DUF3800 domain-containing protein [Marinicauda salina]|uniref:DUF3800 domain-containing protein n=1 Tax=Marinicauda salina TaxID=2135793 RepID=UPI0011B20F27|nr:DUF3800 domain-containing protein [Marinicauda salina]
MHLAYIDDSKGDRLACFAAILIPSTQWQNALDHLIGARRHMKASDGVFIRKEIHATDWLTQRGRVADRFLPLAARVRLFNYFLSSITLLPEVQIFYACGQKSKEERLFERLLNRIQRNMRALDSAALLFSDEGKSYDAMLRERRRVNHIPSMYGTPPLNRPLDRIIEDINYRDSARSLFVQAADCCAFTLLRHDSPTPRLAPYDFPQSLFITEPVMVKAANRGDPLGIIRA